MLCRYQYKLHSVTFMHTVGVNTSFAPVLQNKPLNTTHCFTMLYQHYKEACRIWQHIAAITAQFTCDSHSNITYVRHGESSLGICPAHTHPHRCSVILSPFAFFLLFFPLPFPSPLSTPSLISTPSASLCVSVKPRERREERRERHAFCWLCIMRVRAWLRKDRNEREKEGGERVSASSS